MKRFFATNVLDRIEKTFLIYFHKQWPDYILPYIWLLLIRIVGGLVMGFIIALLIGVVFLTTGGGVEKVITTVVLVGITILCLTAFHWIISSLISICSYIIADRHKTEGFDPKSVLQEAKSYLISALKFDFYYFSLVTLVSLPLVGIFGAITFMSISNLGLFENGDAKVFGALAGIIGVLMVFAIIMLIISYIFQTLFLPNKPQFILSRKESFSDFWNGKTIVKGYFWYVLGNLLLIYTIISNIGSFISGTPNIYTILFEQFGTLKELGSEASVEILKNTLLAPLLIGGGLIGTLLGATISMVITVFQNTFLSVLGDDLRTEISSSSPKMEIGLQEEKMSL